jgi:hypothetical protein
MRIVGEWLVGDDGVTRPVVRAKVQAADGTLQPGVFLIDCGADRTVFSAYLLGNLNLLPIPTPEGMSLAGVGGGCEFVVVETVVELPRDDGTASRIKGQFAAFTDTAESDLSILGREILDHYDLILGREYGEVLLLFPPHRYRVGLE